MTDFESKLEAARLLTSKDLALFLVKPRDKTPLARGWQEQATTDFESVRQMLESAPAANIGVATGTKYRLVVLDVDLRHEGFASLAALEEQHGTLPRTFTVKTGGGGKHYYFRSPEGAIVRNTAAKVGLGLDTRGDGGYVVAPGSLHASSETYDVEIDADLADAPSWLLAIASPSTRSNAISTDTALFSPGRRNTDLFSVAGHLRNKGASEDVIEATLIGLNAVLVSPLAVSEITDIAHSVVRYAPSMLSNLTDLGLAGMFAPTVVGRAAYCPEIGWLVYHNGRWQADDKGLRIQEEAKSFVGTIELEARAYASGMEDRATADRIIRGAKRCQSAATIHNLLKLAASDPSLLVSAADFDNKPGLLNISNGTVDLKTGSLLPHEPSRLLMKRANVTFDPTATCPAFDGFIERVLGPINGSYLLRALAYSLLGTADQQVLFVLMGAGRNGKTTLIMTIRALLGDYATIVEPSSLLRKTSPTINNDIARLKGARAVFTSEFAQGAVIDIPLIKRLTGNEAVAARFLYHEAFEFEPTGVFFLVTNHPPVIDGSDKAITRRIVVVPFLTVIPVDEVDPHLQEKLEAEKAGILNRLLASLREYRTMGLAKPPEIQDATNKYALDSDLIGQFLAEECQVGAEFRVAAGWLYQLYRNFCHDQGVRELSQPSFVRALEGKGFQRHRGSAGRFWHGIASRAAPLLPGAIPVEGATPLRL